MTMKAITVLLPSQPHNKHSNPGTKHIREDPSSACSCRAVQQNRSSRRCYILSIFLVYISRLFYRFYSSYSFLEKLATNTTLVPFEICKPECCTLPPNNTTNPGLFGLTINDGSSLPCFGFN